MQSGVASCYWSYKERTDVYAAPPQLARQLGQRLNCSLPETNFSTTLLTCLRATPMDLLINQSVSLQEETYLGDMIFTPVVETGFGVLPDTANNLLDHSDNLDSIPSIYGYTSNDSFWLIPDPDNNGLTFPEFQAVLQTYIQTTYPPSVSQDLYQKAVELYLPKDPTTLSPIELRSRLVQAVTDATQISCTIYEARAFYHSAGKPPIYLFQFNHRPSYTQVPLWHGVPHAAKKGFVLGLPIGPDPFKYPNDEAEDQAVANIVVQTWTDFAKFGNPTPQDSQNFSWPSFVPQDNGKIFLIQQEPEVREFSRSKAVELWMGEDGNKELTMAITPDIAK